MPLRLSPLALAIGCIALLSSSPVSSRILKPDALLNSRVATFVDPGPSSIPTTGKAVVRFVPYDDVLTICPYRNGRAPMACTFGNTIVFPDPAEGIFKPEVLLALLIHELRHVTGGAWHQ